MKSFKYNMVVIFHWSCLVAVAHCVIQFKIGSGNPKYDVFMLDHLEICIANFSNTTNQKVSLNAFI